MQDDLRTLLISLASGRVGWNERPQASALPAVVLQVASETTPYTYAGAVDLVTSRVQADIYAESYEAALAVDAALVGIVSGYRGTVGATVFSGIFLESRFDGVDDAGSGAEKLHRISRDLMVHHKET